MEILKLPEVWFDKTSNTLKRRVKGGFESLGFSSEPDADVTKVGAFGYSQNPINLLTDDNGQLIFVGAYCDLYVIVGYLDDTSNWDLSLELSGGLTGSLVGNRLSITGATESGTATISATRTGYTPISIVIPVTVDANYAAAYAQASANEKSKTWRQATEPTIGTARPNAIAGDYWIDSDSTPDANRTYVAIDGQWLDERAYLKASAAAAAAQAAADAAAAEKLRAEAEEAKAAQALGAAGGYTLVPAAPSIRVTASKRSISVAITRQGNLRNPAGWRVQITNGAAGYRCPNIAAAADGENWYTGGDDGYLAITTTELTLGFLPIGLVNGLPNSAGQTYYIKVAACSTNAGNEVGAYCAAQAVTVVPTTNADMAAKAVKTAQVDLANYIKGRNPNAPVDGLEAFFSFDDVPDIPTNPQGTAYRWGKLTAEAWGPEQGSTLTVINGVMTITSGSYACIIRNPVLSTYSGRRLRCVLSSNTSMVNIYTTTDNLFYPVCVRNGKAYFDFIVPMTSNGAFYVYLATGTSAQLYELYLGDGSYTPSIPDGAAGTAFSQISFSDVTGWWSYGEQINTDKYIQAKYYTIRNAGFSAPGNNKVVIVVENLDGGSEYFNLRITLDGAVVDLGQGYISPGRKYTFAQNVGAGVITAIGGYVQSTTVHIRIYGIYVGDGSFETRYTDQGGKEVAIDYYGVVPCDGISGKALQFNGGSQYAQFVINKTVTAYTFSFWQDKCPGKMALGSPDGSIYKFGEGSWREPNGEWYHNIDWSAIPSRYLWTITWDGATLRAYVNGVLLKSVAWVFASVYLGTVRVGQHNYIGSSYAYTGIFDEFRFYSRALDANEVAYLYTTPEGPIPAMVYGYRVVAGTVTAREIAADKGIFAKLATSNLEVDAHADVTMMAASLIYSKATAGAYSAIEGAKLLTSPSAKAGQYALSYFDLDNGKLRVGSATKYLYVDPASEVCKFTGNLEAATISADSFITVGTRAALYSSDGHIALCGDAGTNDFGDGLVFANYNLRTLADLKSACVKRSTNLETSGGYKGIVSELRCYTTQWNVYPSVKTVEYLNPNPGAFLGLWRVAAQDSADHSASLEVVGGYGYTSQIRLALYNVSAGSAIADFNFNGLIPSYTGSVQLSIGSSGSKWYNGYFSGGLFANTFATAKASTTVGSSWTTLCTLAEGETGLVIMHSYGNSSSATYVFLVQRNVGGSAAINPIGFIGANPSQQPYQASGQNIQIRCGDASPSTGRYTKATFIKFVP